MTARNLSLLHAGIDRETRGCLSASVGQYAQGRGASGAVRRPNEPGRRPSVGAWHGGACSCRQALFTDPDECLRDCDGGKTFLFYGGSF